MICGFSSLICFTIMKMESNFQKRSHRLSVVVEEEFNLKDLKHFSI